MLDMLYICIIQYNNITIYIQYISLKDYDTAILKKCLSVPSLFHNLPAFQYQYLISADYCR